MVSSEKSSLTALYKTQIVQLEEEVSTLKQVMNQVHSKGSGVCRSSVGSRGKGKTRPRAWVWASAPEKDWHCHEPYVVFASNLQHPIIILCIIQRH